MLASKYFEILFWYLSSALRTPKKKWWSAIPGDSVSNPQSLNHDHPWPKLDWPSQQCFSGRRWRQYPGSATCDSEWYEYHQLYISIITIVPCEWWTQAGKCQLQATPYHSAETHQWSDAASAFQYLSPAFCMLDQSDFNKKWRKNTDKLTQNNSATLYSLSLKNTVWRLSKIWLLFWTI